MPIEIGALNDSPLLTSPGPSPASAAPTADHAVLRDGAHGKRPSLRTLLHEDLHFLVTNRLPRRFVTLAMKRISRIRNPLFVRPALVAWNRFAKLHLEEARKERFDSIHDCFTRELRPGARPVDMDPTTVTSPCDAIVGAVGRVEAGQAVQAKGFPYRLKDLLPDPDLARRHEGSLFVTLRITASMYHHFHAPLACRVREVTYVSGDCWNVHPIALQRVEQLFCKNERAVLDLELEEPALQSAGCSVTLVPVAAILVAGMRFRFLPDVLDLSYRGPNRIACDARFARGETMGHFQHGSTILLFASGDVSLAPGITTGHAIRTGEALLRVSAAPRTSPPRDPQPL